MNINFNNNNDLLPFNFPNLPKDIKNEVIKHLNVRDRFALFTCCKSFVNEYHIEFYNELFSQIAKNIKNRFSRGNRDFWREFKIETQHEYFSLNLQDLRSFRRIGIDIRKYKFEQRPSPLVTHYILIPQFSSTSINHVNYNYAEEYDYVHSKREKFIGWKVIKGPHSYMLPNQNLAESIEVYLNQYFKKLEINYSL